MEGETIVTVFAIEHFAVKVSRGEKKSKQKSKGFVHALQILACYCAWFGASVVGRFRVDERSFFLVRPILSPTELRRNEASMCKGILC